MRALCFLSVVFVGLTLTACSHLANQSPAREFRLTRPFVRDTLSGEYLLGRRIHRFQPIIFKDLVIVGNSIDGIMAYEISTGFRKWKLEIKDGVEGGALIDKGRLYFGASDGQFYCVDARIGKIIWSSALKAEGLSQPAVDEKNVYVLAGNNVARALNKENGQLVWLYDRQDPSHFSIRGGSQPTLDGTKVYLGFSDGYLVALSRSSGQIVWETNLSSGSKRFRDVDASPVLEDSSLFVSSYDGALYSLNSESGQVQWKLDEGGYEAVESAGRVLFYSTTSGKVVAVDKKSGKVYWETQLQGNLVTSPTFTKGLLIVGEFSGALVFLDPTTGSVLKKFDPGMGVNSKVSLDENGLAFFMSGGGNLYGVKYQWEKSRSLWPWQEKL